VVVALLAIWAGGATFYVLFRDDALRMLADRQIALVRAHDREVGALLTEIERLKSIKLLDQQRVERALAGLISRQVTFEQRQTALQSILPPAAARAEPETTAVIPAPGPASAPKPLPLSDSMLPGELRPRLEPHANLTIENRLKELSGQLAQAETRQIQLLDRIERGYSGELARMKKALTDLGMPTPESPSLAAPSVGGPFLPLFRQEHPFEQQVSRVRLATREVARLTETLNAVPLRKPLVGAGEITSGYGMRIDPFLRQLALHTGVDFRAEPGDPVRAAAAGKVTQAGYQGGYGLMVEIDHGNGLVSRYAHLSAIEVVEGASISAGKIVGRVGTTGRSTGPHLHYEIRQNGDAIDPLRFLRVGARLDGF
jgi:murein DD-endopeptidase MepM/ murein hydrolase activator NlpD